MIRTHKIALDPNDRQRTLLAKHAGFSRVAYNFGVYVLRLHGAVHFHRRRRRMTTQAKSAAIRRAAEARARNAPPPPPPEIDRMRKEAVRSTEAAVRYRESLRDYAAAHCSTPRNGPPPSDADGTCPCGGWRSPVSGTCRRCWETPV